MGHIRNGVMEEYLRFKKLLTVSQIQLTLRSQTSRNLAPVCYT